MDSVYEGLYVVKRKIAELEKVHRENIFEFTCVFLSCCAEIDLSPSFGPRRVSADLARDPGAVWALRGRFLKNFFGRPESL
jgi:hypothetical protein